MPLTVSGFQDYRPVVQAAAQAFWGKPVLPDGAANEMALWLSGEGKSHEDETQDYAGPSTLLRLGESASWGYLRVAHFDSRPGHADQLHLDLWWRGLNVAQDPGTYLYNASAPWNNSLARTAVHNTLTVSGREQMTRAGRFLWLDWAQGQLLEHTVAEDGAWERIVACHSGYESLGIEHRRSVTAHQGDRRVVEDQVLPMPGKKSHQGFQTARLHWLLPDWEWTLEESNQYNHKIRVRSPYGWVRLGMQAVLSVDESKEKPHLQIVRSGKLLHGSGAVSPISGWVSATFGDKRPALSVSYLIQGALPLKLVSTWEFPKL
jgi:hypothetical protein